jgi:NDP-sugar pyrophosphorylase family protein
MTSRPTASAKRSSAATPAEAIVKPPCKIHPSAVISEKTQITGSHAVELCEDSVLHPHCKIKADHGMVFIGKSTIICEATIIGVVEGEGNVIVGDGVTIEAGAVVEAKCVGDGTVIEAKVKIGKGAVIGKVRLNDAAYCFWHKVLMLNVLTMSTVLQDRTTERNRCGRPAARLHCGLRQQSKALQPDHG